MFVDVYWIWGNLSIFFYCLVLFIVDVYCYVIVIDIVDNDSNEEVKNWFCSFLDLWSYFMLKDLKSMGRVYCICII